MKVWILCAYVDDWKKPDSEPATSVLAFSTIENVYHYLKNEMAFDENEYDFCRRMKDLDTDFRQWIVGDGKESVAKHWYDLKLYGVDAYYDELQARRMKSKPHRKPRPEPVTQFTGEIDEVDTW